jgi:hypothetical protein
LRMCVIKHTVQKGSQYALLRSVFSHTRRSASHPRGRPHLQF